MMKLALPQLQNLQKAAWDDNVAKSKWAPIEEAIEHIFQCNQSSSSFQQLYTTAYQLVLRNHGQFVFESLKDCMRRRILTQAEVVASSNESTLLSNLIEQWKKHVLTTARTGEILLYLDKYYSAKAKLPTVREIGLELFGQLVMRDSRIADRVKMVFLRIVDQERSGEEVPQKMLLRSLSSMMIDVDKVGIYEKVIEEPYLKSTIEFYQNEASNIISTCSVPQFVEKFMSRLAEERDRASRCLCDSTLAKVEKCAEITLCSAP